jgi:hypothetical protein
MKQYFKYLAKQQLHSSLLASIDYSLPLISVVPARARCHLRHVSAAEPSAFHNLPLKETDAVQQRIKASMLGHSNKEVHHYAVQQRIKASVLGHSNKEVHHYAVQQRIKASVLGHSNKEVHHYAVPKLLH